MVRQCVNKFVGFIIVGASITVSATLGRSGASHPSPLAGEGWDGGAVSHGNIADDIPVLSPSPSPSPVKGEGTKQRWPTP